MNKHVALITPPSVFLCDERVFVHLGILKIASVLEKTGFDIDVVDLSGVQNYAEVVSDYLSASDCSVIGLTATTPQMPAVEKLVEVIRAQRPDARIVLGGPHVTVTNVARKRELQKGIAGRAWKAFDRISRLADVLIAGDGEESVFIALTENPPKLVDADDPASDLFLTPYRLNELPFPARHLVDIHSYKYSIEGQPATSVVMQLGCPYECGFCAGRLSPSYRRVRIRSIQNVLSEVREIYERYHFTGIQFYDDELNVSPRMAEDMRAISDLKKELGVDFKLRGFIKSNLSTEEQAAALREAGFRQICVGFESGSEKILKNINKKATRDQNSRCVEIAHRHGLKVKALMSVGHPGETAETVRETRDWLIEVKPDDFDCTVITTYPGTPYYDEAVHSKDNVWVYTARNGDRLYAYDIDFVSCAQYYKGSLDAYASYVYTDFLKPDEIVKLRNWLETDVRRNLGLSFYQNAPSIRYDHSMGQLGNLPANILRSTNRPMNPISPPATS